MRPLLAPSLMLGFLILPVALPAGAQDVEVNPSKPGDSAIPSAPNPDPVDVPSAPNPNPATVPAESSDLDPASQGETFLEEEGALNPGDLTLSDGSLYKQYVFDGEEGQAITISMASNEFDTYLILVGPEGEMLAQNDDVSESNRNSEISITLPQTGTYLVIANAYDSTGQGNYSITIRK